MKRGWFVGVKHDMEVGGVNIGGVEAGDKVL